MTLACPEAKKKIVENLKKKKIGPKLGVFVYTNRMK